jgi:hypothetical protein
MIDPIDVEYVIVDVIDMHGTIIVQARDVKTETSVSLNFNSLSFYDMTEDDVSHHIITALRREIEFKQSREIPQVTGKPDNLLRLKAQMHARTRIKLTSPDRSMKPDKIVEPLPPS